jgi:hypothetical protein
VLLELVSLAPPVPEALPVALLDASPTPELVIAPLVTVVLEAPPALVTGPLPPVPPVVAAPPPDPPRRGSRPSHPKEQPKKLAPSAPPTRSD